MSASKAGALSAESRSRLGQAAVSRAPAAAATSRVLIVDEDRQVGVTLSFMLSVRRYDDVRAVRSARRAVAVAEQFQPEIVFLDLELPDSGSMTVARQLVRDARPRRPRLIALTNQVEHPMREDARIAGFERYLVKPVSQEELDKILGIPRATA